jgi:hypothetical protein
MVVSQGSMDLVGGHETSISYANIATSDQVPPKWAEEVASWLAPLWRQLSRSVWLTFLAVGHVVAARLSFIAEML